MSGPPLGPGMTRVSRRRWRGRRAAATAALGAALLGACLGPAAPALAHGERSQQAFLRTQTITFFGVHFSTTHVSVGDRLSISGYFYVDRAWPVSLPDPNVAELTIAAPGAVVLVMDRRIGGEFVPETIKLQKGLTYTFAIELRARVAGRFHLHPTIMEKGAGPLIGPGEWIRIDPQRGGGAFTNWVTLTNGKRVNLESYNTSTNVYWHLLYLIPALLMLGYWLRKPLVQRLALTTTKGVGTEELITRRDVRFTAAVGALAVILVGASALYANATWHGIPLQIRDATPPGQPGGQQLTAQALAPARFREATSTLEMTLQVRNNGPAQATLESFATGGLQFNPKMLSPVGPLTLAPGQSKQVTIAFPSRQWNDQDLIPQHEVDTRIGGALLFSEPHQSVQLAEVIAPVVTR